MSTIREFWKRAGRGARTGFRAEKLMTTQPNVIAALSKYFGEPIDIKLGIHGKKADICVSLPKDEKKLQNKNGDSDFHQFGRLSIDQLYEPFRELEASLIPHRFLNKGITKTRKNRPIYTPFTGSPRQPTVEDAKMLILQTLKGLDPNHEPTHLTNTMVVNGVITTLKIISLDVFIEEVNKRVITPVVKSSGTVVDLGAGFTIQFHGSHLGDDNPDHVQVKFDPSTTDPYPFETII